MNAIRSEFRGITIEKNMKKIILDETDSHVIRLSDLDKKEFPAIGFLKCGNKGFLVPSSYQSVSSRTNPMKYFARAQNCFRKGNGWSRGFEDALLLKDWFTFFKEESEFYLFENEKELFKWLSE